MFLFLLPSAQRSAHELPMVERQDVDSCLVYGGQQMILTGQNFTAESKVVFMEKTTGQLLSLASPSQTELSLAPHSAYWVTSRSSGSFPSDPQPHRSPWMWVTCLDCSLDVSVETKLVPFHQPCFCFDIFSAHGQTFFKNTFSYFSEEKLSALLL